jgi:hypothetical protein
MESSVTVILIAIEEQVTPRAVRVTRDLFGANGEVGEHTTGEKHGLYSPETLQLQRALRQ